MRSKKPKADVENVRTFTIKSIKQPVIYDIEHNMLTIDEGLPGNQDPTRTMDMPKDARTIGINEFSTDPEHKSIWVAALPQINEFRVKEGLPEMKGYNANYAAQEVPNPQVQPIPEDETAEIGLEEVFEPPPQPSQDQYEQPQMSRYPGNESVSYPGKPIKYPTIEEQIGAPLQASPALEYIPVTHQTLVTNLKLVNNTLMDFLKKHVGEEDADWTIIEGMMETCDELYKDWEGDARAFIRSSR